MRARFEPITKENRSMALLLHVAQGQEGFVETVAQCLSEASKKKNWRPVGIYDGDKLIGFAMYGRFPWESFPVGRVWLDRFLIGAQYQGLGYGTAVLPALLERIEREYRCRKIYLSVVDENKSAIRLYQKFGFDFNGEKDIHGEDVMVLPIKRSRREETER